MDEERRPLPDEPGRDDPEGRPGSSTTPVPSPVEDPRLSVSAQLQAAARRAGIGQVAPGEVPTVGALLTAVGGVRGLVESILPGFVFVVVFTLTRDVVPAVLVPLGVALFFVVARAVQRGPVAQALVGVLGIGLSALLALLTGRAEDNFVPGLLVNAASLLAMLVSLVARWPFVGVVAGLLTSEGGAWRADRAKRRVLVLTTWLWAGLFAARLAVQLPLYLAGAVAPLAAAKLIMGVPLYAALLWVTWLLVRTVYRGRGAADATGPGA